jgi:hypothetical protein
MDTPIQPSFIPKKPLGANANLQGNSSALGAFILFAAVLVFLASAAGAGGVFAYKQYLQGQITSKSTTLEQNQAEFNLTTIQDLSRLDARMTETKDLLERHTTTLGILNFLSDQTLQTVQFTQLTYTAGQDGIVSIALKGLTNSFATVALQSDQFSASKSLKDVVFSDIAVEQGKVHFVVRATVSPALVNYAQSLSNAPAIPVNEATTTAATSTTLPEGQL